MNIRSAILTLSSIALLGMSQIAFAAWVPGPCPDPSGPAPCIEYFDGTNWWHFNGEGDHADQWHGPDGTAETDFEFCGNTLLACDDTILGPVEVTCNLCLYGQVRKCYDDNDDTWRIGIKIRSGNPNPGDFLCNLLTLEEFPWYAGANSYHGPYNEDCEVGIPFPGPLVGSVGSIGVSPVGVSGAHIHDVSYNNTDTFSFINELVTGSGHDLTGCRVIGDLELLPSNNILSIQ